MKYDFYPCYDNLVAIILTASEYFIMDKVTTAPSDPRDFQGLCLLSMDGGGVRGLSSLHILRVIMNQLNADRAGDEYLKPCDIFDLIGGTSTGG
jgi:hypothetical protein